MLNWIVTYYKEILIGSAILLFIFHYIRREILIRKILEEVNLLNDELTSLQSEVNNSFIAARENFGDLDTRLHKLSMDVKSMDSKYESKVKKLHADTKKFPSVFSKQYQRRLDEQSSKQDQAKRQESKSTSS